MLNKMDKFFAIICIVIFTLSGMSSNDAVAKWVCIGMCGMNLFDLYLYNKNKKEK